MYSAVCSTDNQETNEEIDQMETSRPNRTLEKLQSDRLKMKNNLMALQQVSLKEFHVVYVSCITNIIGLYVNVEVQERRRDTEVQRNSDKTC